MDNLAHKMLHTFEKMDPINPTFDNFIKNVLQYPLFIFFYVALSKYLRFIKCL